VERYLAILIEMTGTTAGSTVWSVRHSSGLHPDAQRRPARSNIAISPLKL
jgi:hypothetical protein